MALKSSENRFSLVDESLRFDLRSGNVPRGDQPSAISKLSKWLDKGVKNSTLLGVTGSGKTFTMANVIQDLNRPALILAHNKTLAAQLYSEFKELFPNNAVRYFVSYYDYYQPEAYVASSDTYIEKDASINDEIDKLRHAATKALFERRDVIVVASVSCIYGLGAPENYFKMMLYIEKGDRIQRNDLLHDLVELQYKRNDVEFKTGTFRVRGDVVEVCPASESERSVRIEFFEDEIEEVSEIDKLSGKVIARLDRACIYPASHYVTDKKDVESAIISIRAELEEHLKVLRREGKVLELHRLEQRTLYDLELLEEMGFCPGIENYSRHLTQRKAGERPPTLIDYFPDDTIVFIDESHVTTPQLVGMYRGDRSRKQNLVDYGFRLPSAIDNRPLQFEEFLDRVNQIVFVSATPADFELKNSGEYIAQQVIRPTGLLDPVVEIRPAGNQVDDLLGEINKVVEKGDRVLVTTLTKRMSEDLTEYFREVGVRVRYLHSDIDTLERVELIKGLREGEYDVLVGINLLREGLDLPEVSLVAILDADKEGFLRSKTALIQTMGRAARNVDGRVILYADKETDSIRDAVSETNRRREVQASYNRKHDITPRTVTRAPEAQLVEVEEAKEVIEELQASNLKAGELPRDRKATKKIIDELRVQMFAHAKAYEFEKAAVFRDRIAKLEKYMLSL